uniref:Uncharacterized protein n=1 Tax=Rhizophora mucronata TaxID=61149 RepID=A0A2P2PAP3_RHIMU
MTFLILSNKQLK